MHRGGMAMFAFDDKPEVANEQGVVCIHVQIS